MNHFWKYTAIVCFSALCGLVTGEYLPNRSIATKDDLSQFTESQRSMEAKIDAMQRQQDILIGMLKGKGVIQGEGGN